MKEELDSFVKETVDVVERGRNVVEGKVRSVEGNAAVDVCPGTKGAGDDVVPVVTFGRSVWSVMIGTLIVVCISTCVGRPVPSAALG